MAAISFQEGLRQLSFTIRNWLNSNAIVNKSLLPNNIELNTVIQSGFYFLNSDNTYYDAPLTSKAGALLWVMQDSDKKATDLYQFYLDKNSMQLYMRTKIEENEFDAWRLIKANNEIIGISTEDLENYKAQILKEVANGYIDSDSYITNKQEQEAKIQSLDKKFEDYATTDQLEDLEQLILSMIVQLSQELNENYFNKEEILKLLNSFTPGGQGGSGIPQIDINVDTDLDTLTDTGIYFLAGDYKYTNHPKKQDQGGLLLCYVSKILPAFRTYQFFVSRAKEIFVRNILGTYEDEYDTEKMNWTNWVSIDGINDLTKGELIAEINAMSKSEFVTPIEGNLFNNKFVEGYRIGGPRKKNDEEDLDDNFSENTLYNFDSVDGYKGTAIVPIEPNTSYWVGINKVIPEQRPTIETDDTKYYSYFALATATKALTVGDNFDGDVFRKRPNCPIAGHLITTGPNDKYLYVQTCRGSEAPYLEIVKVDLNNLPEQIKNLKWYDYTYANKCENDNGKYVLIKSVDNLSYETNDVYLDGQDLSGYNITNIGDYGKVKYALTDAIDLTADPIINNLNNIIQTDYANGLTVEVKPAGNNLFDGSFIDISKGYRIGGSAIASMTYANPSAYIALISVVPGKKYHLYVSPYGTESKPDGTAAAQYLKLGISNYSKEELTTILNENRQIPQVDKNGEVLKDTEGKIIYGHTIPLGHLYQGTVTTDYVFTVDSAGYYQRYEIGKDANGKSLYENGTAVIEANTLVLQVSIEHNLPFILLEEDDSSFETDTGASRYSAISQASSVDSTQKIYYSKALNNSYASHPGDSDNKQIYNTYGDVEISYGRNKYNLKHQWNADQGIRTWRWYKHSIDNGILVENGDCEGPIKVLRLNDNGTIETPNDYIGGFHGNEQLTQVKFFIDGKPIDLTKAAVYNNCKDVKMNIVSNCYWSQSERLYLADGCQWQLANRANIIIKDSDGNRVGKDTFGFNTAAASLKTTYENYLDPSFDLTNTKKYVVDVGKHNGRYFLVLNYKHEDLLFKRTKQLTFTPEKLNIRNYWKYVGEDGKYGLLQSLHTGLYSILFKYLNGVCTNYTNTIYDVPDGTSPISQVLDDNAITTEVTFLGKSFTSSIKALRGFGPYYKGRIKNMDSSTTAGAGDERYKAYLSDGPWFLKSTTEDNTDKVITLGAPNKDHPEYQNEIIGEFEITTTAPNGFFLNTDGTVNTL